MHKPLVPTIDPPACSHVGKASEQDWADQSKETPVLRLQLPLVRGVRVPVPVSELHCASGAEAGMLASHGRTDLDTRGKLFVAPENAARPKTKSYTGNDLRQAKSGECLVRVRFRTSRGVEVPWCRASPSNPAGTATPPQLRFIGDAPNGRRQTWPSLVNLDMQAV